MAPPIRKQATLARWCHRVPTTELDSWYEKTFTSADGPKMDSSTGSSTRPLSVPMTISMDSTTKKYLQTLHHITSVMTKDYNKCSLYLEPIFSMNKNNSDLNHYRTIGRCSGPAYYDVSIRQAARAAFVTSSFKIFLTQTFPRCGATCYILPSRAMTQLFNGVNFVYRSVEVYLTFCSYLRVLVRIQCFYNGGRY